MNTRLNTIAGSLFTLIVLSPHEIVTIILTGALGAIGAFIGSLVAKWAYNKLTQLIKRIIASWSK